jgi:hypothetical protein
LNVVGAWRFTFSFIGWGENEDVVGRESNAVHSASAREKRLVAVMIRRRVRRKREELREERRGRRKMGEKASLNVKGNYMSIKMGLPLTHKWASLK